MTLIIDCYYTQLEQLGAIKCKGDGSVRSGSCSHHIFKNIWSPAVHKGLHYHSNSDVLYVVVVLKMCLCLLYCLICPLDFFLGNWRILTMYNTGPSFLGKVLVQQQCFRYYVCVCVRLNQGENRQIVKLKPPPSFLVYQSIIPRQGTATVFPLLCMCMCQDSWLSKISGGLDQGQNHKIETTTKFSCIWYCKSWELKFSHR